MQISNWLTTVDFINAPHYILKFQYKLKWPSFQEIALEKKMHNWLDIMKMCVLYHQINALPACIFVLSTYPQAAA